MTVSGLDSHQGMMDQQPILRCLLESRKGIDILTCLSVATSFDIIHPMRAIQHWKQP